MNAIGIALNREASDSKSKCGNRLRDDVELSEPQNATKLGDLLQLAYYVILNIQPFSQGNNFLGKFFSVSSVSRKSSSSQAHQRSIWFNQEYLGVFNWLRTVREEERRGSYGLSRPLRLVQRLHEAGV